MRMFYTGVFSAPREGADRQLINLRVKVFNNIIFSSTQLVRLLST